MNVNYEKLDDVRGEITVTLEEKDYADKVKKQLKDIAKARPEPGFRPGHTPIGVIQKKYGDAVKYDVINKEIGTAVYDYIRENKLHVLGNPVPVVEQEVDFTKPDFEFKFKIGLAPELDTKVNKDLHVPFYTIEVTDEMVNDQDNALRRRFGTQGPGEVTDPTAIIKGVLTELNPDGSVKEDGIVVENGIFSLQYFKSEDQKKLFEDKHPGDVVRFNPAATCDSNPTELSSMLNIDKNDVANHLGDFNVDIKEIIVVKPAELNQEYFDSVFGKDKVHNEEEYRKAVKELIQNQLLADSNYRFSIDAKNDIVKAQGQVDLPDDILKDYLKQANETLTDENIDEEYEKMRPELIWQILRDKIVEQFNIKVEEDDVRNLARAVTRDQLAQYGMANVPDELLDKYATNLLQDKKSADRLVAQAYDMKIFSAIKDAVTVDDKNVSVQQFNELFIPAAEVK